jgi:predicted nucleic acid-binding protein
VAAELFVDTSAWFALANRRIAGHVRVERALRERLREGTRIVTTDLVVAETHVLLLRRASHAAALAFLTKVVVAPTVVVSSTPDLEETARVDWLAQYQDQPFSFTDAVSFTVMRERNIREALTLDHHFAEAGFAMLPV